MSKKKNLNNFHIPKTSKIIIGTIVILTVLIIAISLINIAENNKIKNEIPQTTNNNNSEITSDTKYAEIEKLFSADIDISEYQEKYQNKDIIARLEIPNLFNIIITKTTDNDYYLTHSIDKKQDQKGTEYMDFRTDVTSKQINIYGHNSKTYNIAFRKLENFLDKDFFDNNRYILLQHENGRRLYEIVSIKEVTTDYEHMQVEIPERENVKHIEKLVSNSIHQRNISYNKDSNILILQTCSYNDENAFYVITAIELP